MTFDAPDFAATLTEAADDRYGLAATVPTGEVHCCAPVIERT